MLLKRCFHSTANQRKNYYDILKLHERADKRMIKQSYYKLSKKYHPDLNPNNKEAHVKFLEINEAYAVLGNEANKRKYDNERVYGNSSSSTSATGSPSYSRTGGGNSYTQAWRYRNRAPKYTGSASAKEQAEAWKRQTEDTKYNTSEHFAKHYEAEEIRRRQRMENAAKRRKAAGNNVHGVKEDDKSNTWSRLWRLGVVLTGIAYATQTLT